jgi:hypothetical protein
VFILTLALSQSAATTNLPWNPRMVTVSVAVANPVFWDVPIEVCGHVVPSSKLPRESMMFGNGEWLSIDVSRRKPLQVGTSLCLPGVVQRRDGLSYREATARKLPRLKPSHGEDADLIFRPCRDAKSCSAFLPLRT